MAAKQRHRNLSSLSTYMKKEVTYNFYMYRVSHFKVPESIPYRHIQCRLKVFFCLSKTIRKFCKITKMRKNFHFFLNFFLPKTPFLGRFIENEMKKKYLENDYCFFIYCIFIIFHVFWTSAD